MTATDNSEWKTADVFLPGFQLPSTEGKSVGPKHFWQRINLLLAFLHEAQCKSCRGLLRPLKAEFASFDLRVHSV